MADLFNNQPHPFKDRKVFISGYDKTTRMRLSGIINAAGGEKANTISKNVHFIITDGSNQQHEEDRTKLLKNGYAIRTLSAQEVFDMTPEVYGLYATEKEPQKKWTITADVVRERRLTGNALNPYSGVEVYVNEQEGGAAIRQMFGNLGAFANTDIDGSEEVPTNNITDTRLVCFLGNQSLSDLSNGMTNDVLRGIENFHNRSRSKALNVWFITEPDFISFARQWEEKYNDTGMKELLQAYAASRN